MTGDAETLRPPRPLRGLLTVFVLSFVNLVGVAVTAAALGGIEPWTPWQFVGTFGALEAAAGLANVISPNVWRLPVAQLQTSRRTEVELAASTLLLPHWGALARAAAGLVCLALGAWQEGVGTATVTLALFVPALAAGILALGALVARVGVARPERDVFQLVVRWGGRETALPAVSVGASVQQFLLSVATIPTVKLLPPSVLYRPELGPSAAALLVTLGGTAVLLVAAGTAWARRLTWTAPREQQHEAEEHA